MPISQMLVPPDQLAATNTAHYPNESSGYRAARNALLTEEIELRRHIERVAAQRRALPAGGEIPKGFRVYIGERVRPGCRNYLAGKTR